MPKFTIHIHGTGAHNDLNNSADANIMAAAFVDKLRAAGHQVDKATFVSDQHVDIKDHAVPADEVATANPETGAVQHEPGAETDLKNPDTASDATPSAANEPNTGSAEKPEAKSDTAHDGKHNKHKR